MIEVEPVLGLVLLYKICVFRVSFAQGLLTESPVLDIVQHNPSILFLFTRLSKLYRHPKAESASA